MGALNAYYESYFIKKTKRNPYIRTGGPGDRSYFPLWLKNVGHFINLAEYPPLHPTLASHINFVYATTRREGLVPTTIPWLLTVVPDVCDDLFTTYHIYNQFAARPTFHR